MIGLLKYLSAQVIVAHHLAAHDNALGWFIWRYIDIPAQRTLFRRYSDASTHHSF